MVCQGHEQGKLLFGLITIIFPLASPALGKWYPLGRVDTCHQMEVQGADLYSCYVRPCWSEEEEEP